MSATTLHSDELRVSSTTDEPIEFTDWHTTLDREPSEAEEQTARNESLALGNVTSVGRPDDAERTRYYDRLDSHNRDNFWKYRTDSEISQSADTQFKRKTLLAFAHQVSLSPLQRQVALNRFLELDLPRSGHRTEVVAFCVCAVVLNEDAEDYFGKRKPYYPTRNPENNHSEFATLQTRLIERWGAVTESRILSVYQKVRQESLPTSNGGVSRQARIEAPEVQQRPSYSPDWALPQST